MCGRNGQLLSRLEFHLLAPRLGYDIAEEGDVLRGRVVASASVRRADKFPAFNRAMSGQRAAVESCRPGNSGLKGLPGFQVAQGNATAAVPLTVGSGEDGLLEYIVFA